MDAAVMTSMICAGATYIWGVERRRWRARPNRCEPLSAFLLVLHANPDIISSCPSPCLRSRSSFILRSSLPAPIRSSPVTRLWLKQRSVHPLQPVFLPAFPIC
jgi:hypothetical protein